MGIVGFSNKQFYNLRQERTVHQQLERHTLCILFPPHIDHWHAHLIQILDLMLQRADLSQGNIQKSERGQSGKKKTRRVFKTGFFQKPYRIILGPPKHVLHLVWSVLGISTAIKTALKVAPTGSSKWSINGKVREIFKKTSWVKQNFGKLVLVSKGRGTIKEVIKCHFQSGYYSCIYAQNTPD